MGIGFHPEEASTSSASDLSPDIIIPKSAYGLSTRQIAALGFTDPDVVQQRGAPDPELMRAKAFYCGDDVQPNQRIATRMAAGTGAAPGQAPPDLPSLLLDGRICYIGMPLVPAVTELVISELLWLNFSYPEKPVYVYLHSIGSQTPDGQAVGFDTEAYAILDTLSYIRPEIHTLVVGQAFGNAAMILASGKKGCRFALPHARIMTAPPRINRSFGSTSNIMIKANELEYNTQTYVEFLSKFTGRDKAEVRKDVGRNRYFTPEQAIEYGLIDRIVQPQDSVAMEERNYEAMLAQAQAQQRGSNRRAPEGAEAGY
ncbi:g4426 [Coccomyxa elongata]